MNLVIDIGNTVAKLAVFDKEEMVEVLRGSNHSLDYLPMLCHKYPIGHIIIASVISLSNTIRRQLKKIDLADIADKSKCTIYVKNNTVKNQVKKAGFKGRIVVR